MPLSLAEQNTESYYGSYNFRVTINGVTDGINQTFTKVSGVVSESEPVEFKHGSDPYIRKTVGRTKYEDLSLERIYNGKDNFYAWRVEVEGGSITRKDVTVEMLAPNGDTVRAITCIMAWPIKWQLPEMDASSSNAATEVITLSVERVVNL